MVLYHKSTFRLIEIFELFVSEESLFFIFYFISVKFAFCWNMLPDIIILWFIFRLEEIGVSLVKLHGNLFCLTTGLQYFIATHFKTKEIFHSKVTSEGKSSLIWVTVPAGQGQGNPSQGNSSLVRVTAP